jgi:hypothetical protein
MNLTLPVGVVVGEVTVAVNVTFWPGWEGFTEDTTVVVEIACSITCFRTADVLFAFAASPV